MGERADLFDVSNVVEEMGLGLLAPSSLQLMKLASDAVMLDVLETPNG